MAYSDTIDAGFTDKDLAPPRYANFGPRLLASFIDFLVFIPVWGAAYYFTALAPDFTLYAVTAIAMMLLKPAFEATLGGTPGKLLLKLKVLTIEGLPIGWGQALMRSVPWFIGGLVGLYFVYLMFQIPGYTDTEGFTDNALFMAEAMKNGDWNTTNSTIQSVVGFLPLLSALVMLANQRRQSAHDILAETVVVHTVPKVPTL